MHWSGYKAGVQDVLECPVDSTLLMVCLLFINGGVESHYSEWVVASSVQSTVARQTVDCPFAAQRVHLPTQ